MVSSRTKQVGSRAVYKPSVPEGFEWVVPTDDREFELFRDGSAPGMRDSWQAPQMRLLREDGGAPFRRAAMPWLSEHLLVLRDEAIASVGEVLADHGELVPLRCSDARLVAFFAPVLEGVLDEARSEVVRFSTGRVMTMVRPVFRSDALPDEGAFHVAEMPRGSLFLTEALARRIEATGDTTGTDFVPVGP